MSEELHTLVGLYVVDALDDDERSQLRGPPRRLRRPAQQEVAEFRATTGRLSQPHGRETRPSPCAPRSWQRVAGTRQESAPPTSRTSWPARRPLPDARSWRRPLAAPPRSIALRARHRLDQLAPGPRPPGGDLRRAHRPRRQDASTWAVRGTMRVVYSPTLDRSVVVADGLADLPSDRTYALWFIGPGGPEEASAVPHGGRPGHEGARRGRPRATRRSASRRSRPVARTRRREPILLQGEVAPA